MKNTRTAIALLCSTLVLGACASGDDATAPVASTPPAAIPAPAPGGSLTASTVDGTATPAPASTAQTGRTVAQLLATSTLEPRIGPLQARVAGDTVDASGLSPNAVVYAFQLLQQDVYALQSGTLEPGSTPNSGIVRMDLKVPALYDNAAGTMALGRTMTVDLGDTAHELMAATDFNIQPNSSFEHGAVLNTWVDAKGSADAVQLMVDRTARGDVQLCWRLGVGGVLRSVCTDFSEAASNAPVATGIVVGNQIATGAQTVWTSTR